MIHVITFLTPETSIEKSKSVPKINAFVFQLLEITMAMLVWV